MSSIPKRATAGLAPVLALGLALCLAVTATPGGAVAATHAAASTSVASTGRAIVHNPNGTLRSHIKGTTASGQRVTGTFTPLHVVKRHGMVKVRGLVQGVVHRAGGKTSFAALRSIPLSSVNGTAVKKGGAARAAVAARTCSVLHLTLGPLDLNLLGLTVHLNQVVLNIDANSGSGNLLGNLLCAVAGLLDGGLLGQLGDLTGLLNQILGLLNLSA